MKIGIIGQGFVGNAVYQKFKNYFNILTYDLQARLCNSSYDDIFYKCDTIFVCLPTPMNKDGSCHLGIVETELRDLNEKCKFESTESNVISKTIIIKSTVPPGTTKSWNKKFNKLDIIFNPEFLTEANAVKDYENQTRIILGGPRKTTTKLKPLFSKAFPKAHIIKTDSTYAEMVKYVTNAFLATKVSFANEMYEICQGLDIDYDKIIEYAQHDERLGKSHWAVPGPDGDFGYGGHCFPKDVKALIEVAKNINVFPVVLEATDSKNFYVRTDKDWEKMEGRAVV